MRVLLLAAIAAASCGRVGFDAPVDAAGDAAPPPPPTCTSAADEPVLGSFGAPAVLLAGEPGADDDDPEMSKDGLELYFASDRAGSLGDADVWRLVRAHATDPWGAPEHVVELSSAARENTPALSRDALTMWLSTNRGTLDPNDDDIYVARRATRDAPWSTPLVVPELQAVGTNDRGPSLYANDTRLIFHSGRGGGDHEFESVLGGDGVTWSAPVGLAGVTGYRGWMSPCGYELYSQDSEGSTMADFYVARRSSPDGAFGAATEITELSGPAYDQDLRLTEDRRTAQFASARSGPGLLYEASR